MSQNTPRKFSEKIAMINRKQNEGMQEFDSVINEIRGITNKPTNSPGSSNGSPVNGPPPDAMRITGQMNGPMQGHMPQQPHMLGPGMCNGPPHPLASTSMDWNRPGGSLPNVHQMVQQQMPTDYNWGYWQNAPNQHTSYAQTHRTRSPGAQHYHPYRKSNERIHQLVDSIPQNVHLQPPDPSWSNRARSDPTIHMNTMMNPNMYYNNQQQWTPDFLVNGQSPQTSTYCSPAAPPPSHLGYPPAQQYAQNQQQQGMNYGDPNQMHQQQQEIPIGSLPNMSSGQFAQMQQQQQQQQQNQMQQQYQMQQQPSTSGGMSPPMPMSAGPFNHQQLSTPAVVSESQSAPTSPAQSFDIGMHQHQWPPTRHFSASPDTMDIPNIVLTGADGTLDCFQDLQIDSDDMRQLLSDNYVEQQVDPACETQLMNG